MEKWKIKIMNLNPKLLELEEKINTRSQSLRLNYLSKLKQSKEQSASARKNIGCSNFAHAFASCNSHQQKQATEGSKVIGIVSAYNDMLSAHAPLKDYPDLIKLTARGRGALARVAGGVPAMCDGITQGEPGMELSLFSRDVIALSTAVAFSHNVFDAGLCLGVCDKIVPGLMIGALTFGHMPIAFIPAGPMPTGISNKEKSEKRKKYANGEIDRSSLLASEQAAYHSPGTCTFYGTANTNQVIMEVMGLQLPGSSFTPPESPLRDIYTQQTTTAVLELVNQNICLGEMLTAKSWINGMIALLASGGSSNLIIHLIAMAAAGGYRITLEDFDELASFTPTILSVYPSGRADVNEFHNAGGVSALINSLLEGGHLFKDVQTIIGDNLEDYQNTPEEKKNRIVWERKAISLDQSIIRNFLNPFRTNSGLKVLSGNIGTGIIKTSALEESDFLIKAPAMVFNSQESVLEAFSDGDLNQDVVIVVRGQGPSANGMPELHKLTSPLNVLQSKGYKVAVISDGRMSGASGSVPSVIHVSPESKLEGPISKILSGDVIEIDISSGSFTADISADEFRLRKVCPVDSNNEGVGRELFKIFRDNVNSPESGASIFNYESN